MNTMKTTIKILMIMLLSVYFNQLIAQVTTNPDSVCFGSTNESYWVNPNANSTFSWSIDPSIGAVITSATNTDNITVDWSGASIGFYTDAITLVETDISSGCSGFITIDVEVLPLPTATIGDDVTACVTGLIPDLLAIGAEVTWYDDINLTNLVGTGNYLATGQTAVGVYTYYATETLNGCEGPAIAITLTIIESPTVDASLDATICEGETYTLNGVASNNNGQLWTTSGDGSFSDASLLNSIYTPGVNDVANGGVTLTLTSNGNNPCSNISDDMFLNVIAAPTVDAGLDAAICEGDNYTLLSTATNNNGVQWTTSGDGSFSSNTAVSPVYTPGATDVINGTVTLTLTSFGNASCNDVSDDLVLSITAAPTANAGSNTEICDTETYTLIGSAVNYNTITWTTSGDGSFSDINILNPIYTPGLNDITNGSVDLTLSSTGNGSCVDASSIVTIIINPTPNPGPIQHN